MEREGRPAGNRAAETSALGSAVTAERTATLDYALAGVLAIRGCTCEPDITIEGPAGGVQHAYVAHDDSCLVSAGDAA